MDFLVIFKCLKDRESIKVFGIASVLIAFFYLAFSVALSLLASRPLPKGNFIDMILFGGLKAFSTFVVVDWILLILFPIFGGLLFANYTYWKCKSNNLAQSGLIIGLLAATCPACILPILGITSVITFVTSISIYLKIFALALIVAGTYYVVFKQKKCSI